MFSKAYAIVKNFTKPVIVSTRFADGTVESGCATFVVVNTDGWIVTAAHVFDAMRASIMHAQEKGNFETAKAAIQSDGSLSVKQRNRKLEHVKPNPKWITNQSLWWSQNGVSAKCFYLDPQADIAIAKLDGLDLSGITSFPVFNRPDEDPPFGGSLCRLGFPFTTIKATFDEATQQFKMDTGAPMFPNDGIHTRMQLFINPDTKRMVKFIETSTPGLRGQSGGPLFDTGGQLWGIQTSTIHLELGFFPKILKNNTVVEVKEHQFMHVGLSAHVQHVVDLFKLHGVKYDSA